MKLIDLLVKIANRYEDLPKEIEILGNNYILRHSTHMPNYFRKDKIGISISEDLALIQCLTDEVEIIEDKPKKIELLDIKIEKGSAGNCYLVNKNGAKCFLTKHSKMIVEQQNEIVRVLNYLLENCIPFEESEKLNNYIKSISVKSDNIFNCYESSDSNE